MKDDSWMEPAALMTYLAGVCFTFGIMVSTLGPLAVLFAIFWPASWIAYLGYWVAL